MTKTYTQHSNLVSTLGSVPRAGSEAPDASGLTRVPITPLRRAVLAGGAAAVLMLAARSAAAGSAFHASPDADLIALCAGLDTLRHQIDRVFAGDGHGITDAELEAADAVAYGIDVEQRVLLDRVCTLTPTTLGGYAALARSIALLRPDPAGAGPHADPDVRLMAVLVRGLAGRT